MEITEISESDWEQAADLAVSCFINDLYFQKMIPEEQERKSELKKNFLDAVTYCGAENGAFGIKENGRLIAFILFFDYDRLNKSNPQQMSRFFGYDASGGSRFQLTHPTTVSDQRFIQLKAEECGVRTTYLLSLGVDEPYRRAGLATRLVRFVRESYPNHSLLSDISNPESIGLYKKQGFQIREMSENYYWVKGDPLLDSAGAENAEQIYLALPNEETLSAVFGNEQIAFETAEIFGYRVEKNSAGYSFLKEPSACCRAVIAPVSREQLFLYQKTICLANNTEEYRSGGGKNYFIYYRTYPYDNPVLYNGLLNEMLRTRQSEWSIIPDVYVSFPIEYSSISALQNAGQGKYDKTIAQLLDLLDFRTHFESGVPKQNSLPKNGSSFKERIRRYYLGKIKIVVAGETTPETYLTGGEEIGRPAFVDLILSVDRQSSCGVVSVASLSCPFLLSHFLDSIVRNQFTVKKDNGDTENFYEYLEREFQVLKRGTPKAFVTIPNKRGQIQNNELASLLFTETIYQQGENMGRVIDRDVVQIVENEHGMAQYEYAHGYAYSNIFVQISDTFPFEITNRIEFESITLFYIELLMFEESAIVTTSEKIVDFLSPDGGHTPNEVLSKTHQIFDEYSRTIEFWDIQVNYPSSKKSLAMLRNAFRIDEQLQRLERNQNQLQRVFDTQRDLLDRLDSSNLNYILLFFTLLQVLALLVPGIFTTGGIFTEQKILAYLFLAAGLFVYVKLKNRILARSVRGKRSWRKKNFEDKHQSD
ncbi:GNAT family N-acetyltransferase [Caproiciproducens faecalis]|uniref:GNAT family N-acetyltransferase n=1 Tax=Caproiciproducens faecalis TaxID=2820301 RepID=A0ABS7DJE3_9FIRM|nr:N-acetyltransferase [Caproiciproducens faecalis]MBW7571398.1 GNAT family N-acetyltransferase [Caproiciproducens faecalis]